MNDADTRRTRLRAYMVAHKLAEAELARRIGRSPSQTSDMLAGRKAFGEKVARDIELKLGLGRLYLDAVNSPGEAPDANASPPSTKPQSTEHKRLFHAFDGLLPDQQRAVLADLELKARENREQWEKFQRKFGTNGVTTDHRLDALKDWARPRQHELPIPRGSPPPKKRAKAKK